MTSSTFNLLSERWLPFRTVGETRRWLAPHEIVSVDGADAPVAPDWGRADFDAATLEFLIGLLATAFAPRDLAQWRDRFEAPPSPEALADAFSPLARAFDFDGDGPRFLQDFEDFEGEPWPVAGLLIDAPGANAEKNNTDLFQKRGQVERLAPPAAAMALFTLQTYAPTGGAGHRTSLRGGGPLTTLALPPPSRDALWARLLLNVPVVGEPRPSDLAKTFVWLAPTRTSEGKAAPTTLEDLHPLAAFWGTPRRIRLDFVSGEGRCDLTGEASDRGVVAYRTKPWGVSYRAFPHPLSPMRRDKPVAGKPPGEWLFVHPQPGGLSYRDWIDLTFASPDNQQTTRRPAATVVAARERLAALRLGRDARLLAAGYDMDNMKARGFVEATFPLFALTDERANRVLDEAARSLVAGASEVASALAGAVKDALALDKSDASRLGALREALFASTREGFFAAVERLATVIEADLENPGALKEAAEPFLTGALRPVALALFDAEAPVDPLVGREADVRRVVKARFFLWMALNGRGKRGEAIYGPLGLAAPPPKMSKPKGKSRGGKP